jgi:hypothetical protein
MKGPLSELLGTAENKIVQYSPVGKTVTLAVQEVRQAGMTDTLDSVGRKIYVAIFGNQFQFLPENVDIIHGIQLPIIVDRG